MGFDATAYQLDAVYLACLVHLLREAQFKAQRDLDAAALHKRYLEQRRDHGYPKLPSMTSIVGKFAPALIREAKAARPRQSFTRTRGNSRRRSTIRRRTRAAARSPGREPEPPLRRPV